RNCKRIDASGDAGRGAGQFNSRESFAEEKERKSLIRGSEAAEIIEDNSIEYSGRLRNPARPTLCNWARGAIYAHIMPKELVDGRRFLMCGVSCQYDRLPMHLERGAIL